MIETTGTGTIDDPYIIAEWEEFVAKAAEAGVYIKIADDTVWDMNEIHPEAWTETAVTSRARSIDGNGVEIRNVYWEDCDFMYFRTPTSSSTDATFYYNFKITNFYYLGSGTNWLINTTNNQYKSFSNFVLTGEFYNFSSSTSSYVGLINGALYRCSANVLATGRFCISSRSPVSSPDIRHKTLDTCNIKIKHYNSKSLDGLFTVDLKNSYLSGSVEKLTMQASTTSVINMDISSLLTVSGTSYSYTLINSDKTAEGVTIPSSLISCTDEQLKDANYIRSVGFPIVGGE